VSTKLREKLERLYRLAILREEEENDEGRQNEARTSAFLLIKIARENGVKIVFKVPQEKSVTTNDASSRYPHASRPSASPFKGFDDFIRRGGSADAFEELFRDMQRKVNEEKERVARADRQRKESPFKPPQRQKATRSRSKSTRVPLTKANYAGICRVCKQSYDVGSSVWWVQSWGCSHEACGYEELVRQAATG
jgi:hypothetical protein